MNLRLPRVALLLAFACALSCSLVPRAEADSLVESMSFGGQTRTWRLHVPPKHDAKRPSALVVVLHGGGGTAHQVERHTRFSALADREDFLVVYPDGVGKQWNDGRELSAADDVGFICALLDDVSRRYAVDSRRVFATGISNGGFMSARLGATRADRFAAVAPVVSGIPSSWGGSVRPAQPLSVLIIQGTDDPLVPYGGGQVRVFGKDRGAILSTDQVLAWWKAADGITSSGKTTLLADTSPDDGCQVRRTIWTGGRSSTELHFYAVTGGGHGWPGASQYLPERLVGKVCQDFDATETIWAFFKSHPRH